MSRRPAARKSIPSPKSKLEAPATPLEKRQLERLIFFSDAVFAIAITLLVLDLRLPPGGNGVVDLTALSPKLFGFALSFAVIGAYWLHHHVLFSVLVREDMLLRVVNLVFLASIVFLPFPTSIIAGFPATESSVVFYALSVALVGVLATGVSLAAQRPNLVISREGREEALVLVARAVVAPIVFGLSAVVAISRPRLAMQLWWSIAPLNWVASQLARFALSQTRRV